VTYLSKDDIFKAEDLPTRDVEVPEWGGIVRVRALSGSDRDEYDASMLRAQPDGTVLRVPGSRAKLVSLCIVKDNGDPMFSVGDIGRLAQKSATALDRVVAAIVDLSALSDETAAELEGNSDAAPSGDSGSTSPEN
jgi:hypothetical protein